MKFYQNIQCDDLCQWGGAERVLSVLMNASVSSNLHALAYNAKVLEQFNFCKVRINCLFKIELTIIAKLLYLVAPFILVLQHKLNNDLICFSSRFSHYRRADKKVIYLHTLCRLWWYPDEIFKNKFISKFCFLVLMPYRWMDLIIFRNHQLITNSYYNADKIYRKINIKPIVIYPVTKINNTSSTQKNKVNLIIAIARGRSYKELEMIEKIALSDNFKVVIIGNIGNNKRIEYKKNLTDSELLRYYRSCTCVIVPGIEDLGLVTIEALKSGARVIAKNAGGSAEIASFLGGVDLVNKINLNEIEKLLSQSQPRIDHEKLKIFFDVQRFMKELSNVI